MIFGAFAACPGCHSIPSLSLSTLRAGSKLSTIFGYASSPSSMGALPEGKCTAAEAAADSLNKVR